MWQLKTLNRHSQMQDGQLLGIFKYLSHIGKTSLDDIAIVKEEHLKLRNVLILLPLFPQVD